jgi:DNA-directed RNA polymerase specialized sigma24 family protein
MYDYTDLSPQFKWQEGLPTIFSFTLQPKKLGIDVEKHSQDIKKLFYKRQGKKLSGSDIDLEDLLNEVYKGILIRNRGSCPFDPEKSAMSTYIVMVIDCITMNYVNKDNRIKDRFVTGVEDDVASSYNVSYEEDPSDAIFLEEIRNSFSGSLLKVFDALMDGLKKSHISRKFGWEIRLVNKYVKQVREKVAYLLEREDLVLC